MLKHMVPLFEPNLLVFSVENGNPSREKELARTKNLITDLAASKDFRVAFSLSSRKNEILRPSWRALARWKFHSESELRNFMAFQRGTSQRTANILGGWYRTLEFLLSITMNGESLDTQRRICATERSVTKKHIDGWFAADKHRAEWLLVLEDDATTHPRSAELLSDLFSFLASQNFNLPVYLDVAGGFDFKVVSGSASPTRSSGFFKVIPPSSNTACGYILSRGAVQLFRELLEKHPHLREIGIDFAVNSIFTNSASNVHCVHMRPPALSHGSMSDTSESWDPRQN